MNITINTNESRTIFNQSLWSHTFQPKFSYSPVEIPRTHITRSSLQQRKPLSSQEIIEICTLCLILIEHTVIFILTFRKKVPKITIIDPNDQQSQQPRSIIFPSKTLLYNCLHRNWIRAYSFSNICLSFVYFLILILKHYHPNLLHHSSVTFYSLPLTLVQQIVINFNTFHLFIISISILQYFIRYYRLFKNKYSLNIYNGRNLLITKHTNVALILSGSLALIFGYNYIFYIPRHSQTFVLLPLIALNMLLLPLINIIILIFIIICCVIDIYNTKFVLKPDSSFDNQGQQREEQEQKAEDEQQQQRQQQNLADNLRSTIEKTRCIKCYSKFLKQNRSLLQDTDPYTKLHTRFFSHNPIPSARTSITLPDDKRKYSTISYENIQIMHDAHTRLRTSYPCQPRQSFLLTHTNRSPTDFSNEQRTDVGRNSATDLFLQTIILKVKRKRSLCHLCYHLLLLFLLKYVLLTFPQHIYQMIIHLKQFSDYFLKHNTTNTNHLNSKSEFIITITRFLFLFARFGDSLLLTRIPYIIKKYFPCWCRFNSKLLRKQKTTQRVSHQILMKNTDSSTNEALSNDDIQNGNDSTTQKDISRRQSTLKQISRRNTRRFRLRFQFVPIWSKQRQKLVRQTC